MCFILYLDDGLSQVVSEFRIGQAAIDIQKEELPNEHQKADNVQQTDKEVFSFSELQLQNEFLDKLILMHSSIMIDMKHLKTLITLLAILIITQTSSSIKFQKVISLTAETHASTLKENMYVLVQYYSPNCKHSLQFAEEYESLARKVEEQKLNYVIAAVDLSAQDAVNDDVSVLTFPTFIFYINNSAVNYRREAKANVLLQFMKNLTFSRLPVLKTIDGLKTPFVALYGVPQNSDLHSLPILIPEFPVYHIKESGKNEFIIKVFTDSLTSMISYYANLNELIKWILPTVQPLVISIAKQNTPKRLEEAMETQHPLLVLVKRDKHAQEALRTLKKYCFGRFTVVCGQVSPTDQLYPQFSEWLQDPGYEKSSIVVIDTVKWSKYMYKGDLATLTEEKLERFVQSLQKYLVKKDPQMEAKMKQAGANRDMRDPVMPSNRPRQRQQLPRRQRPNFPQTPKPSRPLQSEQL